MHTQLLNAPTLTLLFYFAYIICVIGILIYILRLLVRFVSAQERVASALEIVARKMKDDAKP
jgi:hypothetical protein